MKLTLTIEDANRLHRFGKWYTGKSPGMVGLQINDNIMKITMLDAKSNARGAMLQLPVAKLDKQEQEGPYFIMLPNSPFNFKDRFVVLEDTEQSTTYHTARDVRGLNKPRTYDKQIFDYENLLNKPVMVSMLMNPINLSTALCAFDDTVIRIEVYEGATALRVIGEHGEALVLPLRSTDRARGDV